MSVVYLIDDDPDIQSYVKLMLDSIDIPVVAYGSVNEFLGHFTPQAKGCILSDVVMPEINGIEFQQMLINRGIETPVIFMSAFGDIAMVKGLLKNGAMDFIEKPISATELIAAIKKALSLEVDDRENQALKASISNLTPRERQILKLLSKGKSNHEISSDLNISIRTVETHRCRILKKMHVDSLQRLLSLLISHDLKLA